MRWPWPNDLDTQTWPRYCQDIPPHQKWSFYVNCLKTYCPNRHTQTHRHTDMMKTLPLPHTREVKTQELLGPYGGPWTPTIWNSLHSCDSASLRRQTRKNIFLDPGSATRLSTKNIQAEAEIIFIYVVASKECVGWTSRLTCKILW